MRSSFTLENMGDGFAARDAQRFPQIAYGISPMILAATEAYRQTGEPRYRATAERLAEQGADVFITGTTAAGCTTLPAVDGLHPLVAPLVNAVTFYAFVETLALRRGFDPDTPPHLRKVTRTL